jgi:hypothetical protein
MIDKLRDEIIESQKAKTDLLKWKLILVAGIGAAVLGFGSSSQSQMHKPGLLLALILLTWLAQFLLLRGLCS